MSELLVNLMYVEKVLGSKHKDYYDKACTMHIYYYVVGSSIRRSVPTTTTRRLTEGAVIAEAPCLYLQYFLYSDSTVYPAVFI